MNEITNPAGYSAECACPSCSSADLTSSIENDSFQYGGGESAVTLSVLARVHHCNNCGLSYTGEDVLELRHDAVCSHLGVMSPKKVRQIRGNFSQAEFSEITKIGKASLARWESGALIQNQANDSLLYLLSFAENIERLKKKNCVSSPCVVLPFQPKFRAIKLTEIESLKSEAKKFELFPQLAMG
jgi:putative zinc finger/helix-turn-helix YgiT family protein